MAARENDGDKLTVEQRQSGGGEVGGSITMNEDVVATVAGMAARQIDGIYSLGKSRIMRIGGESPTRGVKAEVGENEAAIDLEIVIEHGVDLKSVADQLRKRVSEEVNKMAGRKVVEININVSDIHLPGEEEEEPKREDQPRVR